MANGHDDSGDGKELKPTENPTRTLSQIRGDKRHLVTNGITKLKRYIAERDTEKIRTLLPDLKGKVDDFDTAHEHYHVTLQSDEEIAKSEEYYGNVIDNYSTIIVSANTLLDQVSTKDVHVSNQSQSKCNSDMSTNDIVMLSTLDRLELKRFSGEDPLEYVPFITTFKELIDKRCDDDNIKLTRLLQYTEGKAYRAIRMCRLTGAKGYRQALSILEEEFNDKYEISAKLIRNLKSGSPVETGEQMLELAHDLKGASATLENLGLSTLLETQDNIKGILTRFPDFVFSRYKKKALKTKKSTGLYPDFTEFVNFVRDLAREELDPMWGSDSDSDDENKRTENKSATGFVTDVKQSVFSLKPTHNSQPTDRRADSNAPSGFFNSPIICPICNQNHYLVSCPEFRKMNPSSRLQLAKTKGLCFLCLVPGHTASTCKKSEFKCKVCNMAHSKWLHIDPNPRSNEPTTGTNSAPTISNSNIQVDPTVVLPMIKLTINRTVEVLALLDNGSTSTFISEWLANELKLTGKMKNYNLSTLSQNQQPIATKVVSITLDSQAAEQPVTLNNVLVVPDIPARAVTVDIDLKSLPFLDGLPIVHHSSGQKAHILIGLDNPGLLMPLEVKKDPMKVSQVYATKSYFGWHLSGILPPLHSSANSSNNNFSGFVDMRPCENETHWYDNDFDDRVAMSIDDRSVHELWDNNSFHDGQNFVVPIPFRPDCPSFPDNKAMALKRLKSLVYILKNKGVFERYDHELMSMVEKGYAEEDPFPDENDEAVWFLPTFPVFHPHKDKVRPVHDARAEFDGTSFNSQVYQGPDLNNKLIDVLLRFRQYPHALMCDIKDMYMQVKFPEHQRKSMKFFWFKNGQIKQFRMCRHFFGGKFCASSSTYAFRKSVLESPCQPTEATKKAAIQNCYVDNVLHSEKDKSTLVEVAQGVKSAAAHGGMIMTQYVFNDMDLMEMVPEHDRERSVRNILPEMSSNALGISWILPNDVFSYQYSPQNGDDYLTVCKRIVLGIVNKVSYDPVGLISPITFKGKCFFQELVKLDLDWDTPAPTEFCKRWHDWIQSLITGLKNISFDRCLIPNEFTNGVSELHMFCDGSTKGYSCVCYIRTVTHTGKIYVNIVAAKSRLTPKKGATIPRIELAGACTSAKLCNLVRNALDIDIVRSTYWTDSKIVLGYIQNNDRRFKPFVANRVNAIRQTSSPTDWRYIDSANNPADVASRGCDAHDLPQIWYRGPSFLSLHRSEWPTFEEHINLIPDDDPEIKKETTSMVSKTDVAHPIDTLLNYYSSYYRLKKAVCWLLRVKNVLRKSIRIKGAITLPEMTIAEMYILKHVQSSAYSTEIKHLTSHGHVQISSTIRKLDPVLDSDELLVVGGRLNDAPVMISARHPIILPYEHRLSQLIVEDTHGATHLGTEWTLSQLRCKYWITKCRKLILKVKSKCITCKKLFGQTMNQKMAHLPPERCLSGATPFSHCGCDVFGPFKVKYGRGEIKRYILLFTCFSVRAVHLEKLEDLTSDLFINALIRFVARRGKPNEIWSDNATNFVGASRELKSAWNALDKEHIVSETAKRGIQWRFNPPLASHQSGVWERPIRTVRKVLTSLLGTCYRLTDDVLHTVICEAENVVNSRPLTYCSDSVNDFEALTPNHLLIFQGNNPYPWGTFQNGETYRKRWKQVQTLVDSFWKRWLKEYLPSLQARSKWHTVKPDLKVGALCLIADEGSPFRGVYPLGKVIELTKGRDGHVRSAKLKTQSSKNVVRPITKLINLECD